MPGIEITQLDDGRIQVIPSQSWIGTFFNCAEQARHEMVGTLPRKETDATAIGTAMHSGIESVLLGGTVEDGVEVAKQKFEELSQLDEFQWVQIKTVGTGLATVERTYWSWANEILPHLPRTVAVEHSFDYPFFETDKYVVRLKGTMDFIGEGPDGLEVWDWKTAGRPWDAYETKWKIQPTIYTWALAQEYPDERGYDFVYAIMMKSKQDVQVLTTGRDQRHWDWLRMQLLSMLPLMEAELPHWPMRDQHSLCSPKWCGVYDICRGATGLR